MFIWPLNPERCRRKETEQDKKIIVLTWNTASNHVFPWTLPAVVAAFTACDFFQCWPWSLMRIYITTLIRVAKTVTLWKDSLSTMSNRVRPDKSVMKGAKDDWSTNKELVSSVATCWGRYWWDWRKLLVWCAVRMMCWLTNI